MSRKSFMAFGLLTVFWMTVRNAPAAGLQAEFFRLCDIAAGELNSGNRQVPFYQDSYAVRALAVACDISEKNRSRIKKSTPGAPIPGYPLAPGDGSPSRSRLDSNSDSGYNEFN